MWHSILIVFVALAIAGLVANFINIIAKSAIWIGYCIHPTYDNKVDFTWNIIIGFVLSLGIALFFLL